MTISTSRRVRISLAHATMYLMAAAVSLRHDIAMDLDDGEPHLYCHRLCGLSPWRLSLWRDAPEHADEQADGCVNLHILGCHIEVYWVRKSRRLHTVNG